MNGDRRREYFETIRRICQEKQTIFVERKFELTENEGRLASEDLVHRGWFREDRPDLTQLLKHQHILLIGEPGSGKSYVLIEISKRFSRDDQPRLPIPIHLREYRGNLSSLVSVLLSTDVLEGSSQIYLLDGLDEIPTDYLPVFQRELEALSQHGTAQIVLSVRQAFIARYNKLLPKVFSSYQLLDFDDGDIRQYSRESGLDPDRFSQALVDSDCVHEARNPLALSTLVKRYQDTGSLSRLRADNLSHLVDGFLKSRPALDTHRQRRAVRMIAVTMEIYSRNELTLDEAKKVLIYALAVNDVQASEYLEELYQSILLRTTNGLAFSLPSYGEYLAADELQSQSIDRVKELAFLQDGQPNESWRNTISYLAEINSNVRKYFAERHPEWLLNSSQAAFTEAERHKVFTKVFESLTAGSRYLIHHPTVRGYRLARFVTPEGQNRLLSEMLSANEIVRGNAILLLGIIRHPAVIAEALPLATQTGRSTPLRLCAIAAISNSERAELADQLWTLLDRNDPLHNNIADCIGMLATDNDLGRVLELVSAINSTLSGTFTRMRTLRSPQAALATLAYLRDHPSALSSHRIDGYIENILEGIKEYHNVDIARGSVDLIVAVERANHWIDRSERTLHRLCAALKAAGFSEAVCMNACQQFIDAAEQPIHTAEVLTSLINDNVVTWLIEHAPAEFIRALSWRLPPGNIRMRLVAATGDDVRPLSPEQQQWHEEELARVQSRDAANRKATRDIESSSHIEEALQGFADLNRDGWPDLSNDRRQWLGIQISDHLANLDLQNSIREVGPNSWQHPRWLETALLIVDFYDLTLAEDASIIQALRSWCDSAIIKYVKAHPLSPSAIEALNSVFATRPWNNRIIRNLLSFLDQTGYESRETRTFLDDIVGTEALDADERAWALRLLVQGFTSTTFAERYVLISGHPLQDTAANLLIDSQHQPTVERALQRLIDDVAELRAAERPFPENTPLHWIGKIRSRFAWEKLVTLRRLTVRNNLPNIAGVITETLKRIDLRATSGVVRAQMQDAPIDWRLAQVINADEYERGARLAEARALPFEVVVRKLIGNTSILRLKVWCEGSTDIPVFRAFLKLLGVLDVTFDFVGGWGNLQTKVPERLRDGCREVVVVMDGDNGRKLGKRNKPLSEVGKKETQRLKAFGIPLYVLERYGIENYLSQAAFEAVLGRSLADYFPFPHEVSIQHHFVNTPARSRLVRVWRRLKYRFTGIQRPTFYKKELNERVVDAMNISDIENTDLRSILEEIRNRIEFLRTL